MSRERLKVERSGEIGIKDETAEMNVIGIKEVTASRRRLSEAARLESRSDCFMIVRETRMNKKAGNVKQRSDWTIKSL